MLHLKQTPHGDPQDSSGKSAQRSLITQEGRERKQTDASITASLHCTPKTNRALLISYVAERAKNLPAMRETWVQSLGQEDPLEEGMATQSRVLASEIPWTEEPGGLQSMGLQSQKQLSN